MKLKEIRTKELEIENEKALLLEKSRKAEEGFFMMQEIKARNLRLEEAEKNFLKREEILQGNEERLAMKMEDIAGYEFKLFDFQKNLENKQEKVYQIAKEIEEKKDDIEKTAKLFEQINNQLQKQLKFNSMQAEVNQNTQEFLKNEENRLKNLEKSVKQRQKFENHKIKEFSKIYDNNFSKETKFGFSDSFEEDSSEDNLSRIDVRTPE